MTPLEIWDDGAPSQYNSIEVKKLSNGYYELIHSASGKALEVYGGVSDNNARISLLTRNGSNPQQWAITRDGYNGGYMLRVKSSGYAMDLSDAITENGHPVCQHRWNGSKAETWVFVPAEYSVSYDANGGQGAPEAQIKYYKSQLILSDVTPVRDGYVFLGWAVNEAADQADYQPGDAYDLDEDMTLYAVWEKEIRLELPAALVEIDEEAFANCGASVVVIPHGCEEIGAYAFANSANLTKIYIPGSVVTIARTAFNGCPSNLIIYGKSGSVAQSFATAKGYTFVVNEP